MNEFSQIPNPDNTPGAVSSGYQRQNTNLFVLQTGLDLSCLYLSGDGRIILKSGSVIEYNGVMFKSIEDIDLTSRIINIFISSSPYPEYCFLAFDAETLIPTTDRGVLIPDKYARYLLDTNYRVLNTCIKMFSWTARSSGISGTLQSIIYGNNLFVAVGYNGNSTNIITSPDGINWTARSSGISGTLQSIIYTSGLFIAVGGSAGGGDTYMIVSSDGINWTTLSLDVSGELRSIAYGNNLFVAVGYGSSSTTVIITSPFFNFGKYNPGVNRYEFSDSIYQLND
jgi:hypothetical protein